MAQKHREILASKVTREQNRIQEAMKESFQRELKRWAIFLIVLAFSAILAGFKHPYFALLVVFISLGILIYTHLRIKEKNIGIYNMKAFDDKFVPVGQLIKQREDLIVKLTLNKRENKETLILTKWACLSLGILGLFFKIISRFVRSISASNECLSLIVILIVVILLSMVISLVDYKTNKKCDALAIISEEILQGIILKSSNREKETPTSQND